MLQQAFLLVLLASATVLQAQPVHGPNIIYLEAGGNGMTVSINYERQLKSVQGMGVHIGIGLGGDLPQVPIGVKYLFNLANNKSFIETGFGLTLTDKDFLDNKNFYPYASSSYIAVMIPSVGYRHQTSYGLMWRVNFTPGISKTRSFVMGGVSLGWNL